MIHEPVTAAIGGHPPEFIVGCAEEDCSYVVDVHAATAEDAVAAVVGHQPGHHLRAHPVNYSEPRFGKDRLPHPLYFR